MRFFPREKGKKRPLSRVFLCKGRFPFLAWEKSHLAGIDNRGSLISVPLALRGLVQFSPTPSMADPLRRSPRYAVMACNDSVMIGMWKRECPQNNHSAEMWSEVCLQKCVGGFLLYKFWRILPGIFLEDFSGHFFPRKWGEKIRRQNPRKNPAAQK